jgi:hypothetical protein
VRLFEYASIPLKLHFSRHIPIAEFRQYAEKNAYRGSLAMAVKKETHAKQLSWAEVFAQLRCECLLPGQNDLPINF